MPDYLSARGGVWVYRRRVPKEFAELDKRKFAKQSTKIAVKDDPRGAKAHGVAALINRDVERYWAGLTAGKAEEARARYDLARRRSRTLGFSYEPASVVANLPTADIIARLDKIEQLNGEGTEPTVSALLGGVDAPRILLSQLYEEYEALQLVDIRDMSANQKRLWRNPKVRAVRNLIGVVGDKALTELHRNDALEFRDWWQVRILEDGMHPDTANKDIHVIQRMIVRVEKAKKIGAKTVFNDLRFAATEEEIRQPFAPSFVQSRILRTGAIDGLNLEARCVVYIMAETGLRPSEIVNLTQETIVLRHAVPHLSVKPDGRRMKTPWSRREIPLVGVALMAAKACPNGFPRYRDKASGLSALVNKFLFENGFRPTEDHTLYSLRHTFEDRLTAADAPDKMIAMMMGHKFDRPRYGKGPTLQHKRQWLRKIAFKPPARI